MRDLEHILGDIVLVTGQISVSNEKRFHGENQDYNIARKERDNVELRNPLHLIVSADYANALKIVMDDCCPGKKECQKSGRDNICLRNGMSSCPGRVTCLQQVVITYRNRKTNNIESTMEDHFWINNDFGKWGFFEGDQIKFFAEIKNYQKRNGHDYSISLKTTPNYLSQEEQFNYMNFVNNWQ